MTIKLNTAERLALTALSQREVILRQAWTQFENDTKELFTEMEAKYLIKIGTEYVVDVNAGELKPKPQDLPE